MSVKNAWTLLWNSYVEIVLKGKVHHKTHPILFSFFSEMQKANMWKMQASVFHKTKVNGVLKFKMVVLLNVFIETDNCFQNSLMNQKFKRTPLICCSFYVYLHSQSNTTFHLWMNHTLFDVTDAKRHSEFPRLCSKDTRVSKWWQTFILFELSL